MKDTIEVCEIFNSISGEVGPFQQGSLTTFLRLYGCNLDCEYCDTKESHISDCETTKSFNDTVEDLINTINFHCNSTDCFCITGGEPLIQKQLLEELVSKLDCDLDFWIETNGTIELIPGIHYVMDFKWHSPPLCKNYSLLSDKSIIKFLISSEKEFQNFLNIAEVIAGFTTKQITLAIGCLWGGGFDYQELMSCIEKHGVRVARIREQGIKIIVNAQMHKHINLK